MSYLFTCPHCKSQTLVGDEYSGLAGDCAVCREAVELPDFAGLGPVDDQPVRESWMAHRSVRLAIAGTITLALTACLLFVFIKFSSSTLAQLQANRRKQQDASNLVNIAKALNAYAADYGQYPPPVTNDANGQPMHSWRVLILPYLGQEELYRQYDMEQSWDANMNQIYSTPAVYQASAGQGFGFETAYFLVTGPGTLFPTPTTSLSPEDLVDDPAKTILVVEGKPPAATGLNWMEPVDLDIRKMQFAIAGNDGVEIGGQHQRGAVVATVDGRSHFLRDALSPVEIRALLSPAGGEPLADDILD
ncbi:DUF1559 family PulG-like putative transporter [Roseimaritima ulvae]|uniref:DUF1559 domain-containing protein n=1 Tax=Roseimaritima ulvae TaxID=980254 RepID=A0A5B9QV92_9BACT|nr:DUF1559 domain-containing protein [Roseimaritima ulvae]QEG42957.1 hypothetical protein UC8_50000 [Roseimaritima ulvae]